MSAPSIPQPRPAPVLYMAVRVEGEGFKPGWTDRDGVWTQSLTFAYPLPSQAERHARREWVKAGRTQPAKGQWHYVPEAAAAGERAS